MKILRQGEKTEYVWRGYCTCGCVFQLDGDDERNIKFDMDCAAYFKCPCCEKSIRISKHDVREPMNWFKKRC